jgi:uncharacterized protein YceH (UPF0502 family)
MEFDLSTIEVRLVGALLEKEVTTPEYYPLSLNALTLACNQKSNRDPVMSLTDETVAATLESLRGKGLVVFVHESGSRVEKYRQRLSEVLNLDRRELAILCGLMLRGFQTVGELRERSQRLYAFDELAAVELCLNRMMERSPAPIAMRLPRAAGSKEPRYAHLLTGTPQIAETETLQTVVGQGSPPSQAERLSALETQMAALRQDVSELRGQLAAFRKQFE